MKRELLDFYVNVEKMKESFVMGEKSQHFYVKVFLFF